MQILLFLTNCIGNVFIIHNNKVEIYDNFGTTLAYLKQRSINNIYFLWGYHNET